MVDELDFVDEAQGFEQVRTLDLREFGRFAPELRCNTIGPKQDGQLAEFGGFLKEAHLRKPQIVEGAGDYDFVHLE
jgi:hypothetical protein